MTITIENEILDSHKFTEIEKNFLVYLFENNTNEDNGKSYKKIKKGLGFKKKNERIGKLERAKNILFKLGLIDYYKESDRDRPKYYLTIKGKNEYNSILNQKIEKKNIKSYPKYNKTTEPVVIQHIDGYTLDEFQIKILGYLYNTRKKSPKIRKHLFGTKASPGDKFKIAHEIRRLLKSLMDYKLISVDEHSTLLPDYFITDKGRDVYDKIIKEKKIKLV